MRERGVLDPTSLGDDIVLERTLPPPELAPIVERFWSVRWQLAAPRVQETLPYPCVNIVLGAHRPGVHGTTTKRFVAKLDGSGWVLGVKFQPASFRAFSDRPMTALVDRTVPIAEMFGAAFERDVMASPDRLAWLAARFAGTVDPDAIALNELVARIELDRELTRVAEVAAREHLPVRTLERLFRHWIGVTPKAVLTRFRLHEAAARIASGEVVDWSALAHELGYFDQPHFIRAFKAQIGRTPRQHAASISARPARASG